MIVCVVGPTAVGKTRLSEELSKKLDAIVVNCDAMQVYKEMNIGTAKYTEEEDLGQPHYLFDIASPNDNYTVYDYQKDLRKVLEDSKDRNVIIVGGTGLYLKAGLYDYEFEDRKETNTYDEFTNEELYEMLKKRNLADGVHVNNRRRLISRLNSSKHNNHKDIILYDDVHFVGLMADKEKLYERIDRRVEVMMENGLLKEVEYLYDKYGYTKALRTGICYKELVVYLKGLVTLEESIRLMQQKCRNYAKRQYTWFKYQMDINWFDVDYDNFENTIDEVIKYIKNKSVQD